ncbi:MAG: hypothetical protein Q8P68_04780 [Candidatus Peregrinibacteria bacterium]|nr:hypothetical protein [Candidatus Peregrinibacteria bacterium]
MENQKSGCLKSAAGFLSFSTCILLVAMAIKHFFPNSIPVDVFFVWKLKGSLAQWIIAVIPVLFMGLMTNILTGCWSEFRSASRSHFVRVRKNRSAGGGMFIKPLPIHFVEDEPNEEGEVNQKKVARVDPIFILTNGFLTSVVSGVTEEVIFRWLLLLDAMPVILVLNFVTFGLLENLQVHLLGPIANVLTFGYLEEFIFFKDGWQFGFALFWSALQFKSGHNYQQWLARTSSWFFGMYMFGLTMTFGLPIAIAAHFLCNMLISFYAMSTASTERMRKSAEIFANALAENSKAEVKEGLQE